MDRDDPVVLCVVVEESGVDDVTEVQTTKTRHVSVHIDIYVDNCVDGGGPVGEGGIGEAFDVPGAELVEEAQAKGLGDCLFVRKELVDGTDGHTGTFGDPGGGQVFVSHLVEQVGTAVEHSLDTEHAALLGRETTERCLCKGEFVESDAGRYMSSACHVCPGAGVGRPVWS